MDVNRRGMTTDLQQMCTPITYSVEDAETCMTLLTSKESNVVGRALSNLCKNIEADEKLLDFLMSKGIFAKIADLLKSQLNLVNLKYTLKLFGLVVIAPSNIEKLDKWLLYDSIPRLLQFYFLNKDDFVKEACSLILVKTISFSPVLSSYVCFRSIMRRIVKVLRTSVDPDVLKNSLELFRLLMNCEEFLEQIRYIKRKHLNIFLCFLDCGVDPIADIAMDILHQIAAMKFDKVRKKMAKGETLSKMVSIVISNKRKYVEKATDVISNCVRNKQAAVHFSFTKDFVNIIDYLKVCDNNSLLRLLPIFSVLSKTSSIRKKMYAISAENVLFQFLKYRHEAVVLSMCQIIANFSMHKECCKKILTPAVMKYLVDVLKTFPMEPCKVNAMKAIYSFVRYESTALKYLSQSGALDVVQTIFLDNEETYPQRFYEMASEITCDMVCSPLMKELDIKRLCEKIMDLLRTQFSNRKVLLKMISMLMDHVAFRKQFVISHGPAYFISIIQRDLFSETYQLSLDIIQNLVGYEDMAIQFLDLGLMSLLTSMINKGNRKSDVYKDIVDNLYDSCLTLKLHDKKYLGDEDAITRLFFLFQEYTLTPKDTEFKPIYVVNIEQNDDVNKPIDSVTSFTKTLDTVAIKAIRNRSAGIRAALSHSLGVYSFDEDFLPKDEYLEQYILDLHNELYISPFTLKERIKKVAFFVERQLSGIVFTNSEEEKLLHFKRHIGEICMNLGHRFIPLGFLRMGYVCEKAFMFKVLCDNVGIPSSFHHEKNGLFWNGISLQEKEIEAYIVDFKDKIGSLIPQQSDRGQTYLGI